MPTAKPLLLSRLSRGSNFFRFDPPQFCRCGGELHVEDYSGPNGKGASREFRYECYCEGCKTCDPNGWPTQAELLANAPAYFLE